MAPQASLSMRFSRQEYWSGLPFPSPGDHLKLYIYFYDKSVSVMQALLLAQKFCCAVQRKSSHVLAQLSVAAEPRAAIATPRLADMSACPSRTAPEGPTYIAISRDSHRKTENINTSHLFALIKEKSSFQSLQGPLERKGNHGIQ